ncbi:MAG TPA: O-antigen ligase family protein [Terriglobia bacterium]|nr:O-antigen ligase family protein [Terriglobia bacterium]
MGRSLQHELTLPSPRRWIRETATAVETEGPKFAFKLLILFLLILYSNVAIAYPELDSVRPALVVAVAAISMLVLELGQARQTFRLMWPQGFLLIAFVGVCFLSSFTAFWPGYAFGKTMDLAKIVLIYIVIENTVTTPRRLRTVLMTMVIGGMFPAVGTISHYAQHILRDGRATWIGVWNNPNEDAYGLLILIPIAGALAMKSNWPVRIGLAAIVGTFLLAIFFTYSRGGFLGLVAVLGLAGWKQKSPMVRTMMILGLAAMLLFGAMYWQRSQGFNDISHDATVNERIGTFIAGLRMFQASPLVGIGPGCSMFAYPIYAPEYARCGCATQLVVHNSFIQVLGETGILGFLPFMMLLGFSLFHAWKLQRGTLNIYASALEVALWGFIVCSLSGGFSYSWWPYILIALTIATKHMSASHAPELTDATS